MIINRSNLLPRFVYFMTRREDWDEMPESLCSYFWAVVTSILFFPITILGVLMMNFLQVERVSSWAGSHFLNFLSTTGTLLVYVLLLLLGCKAFEGPPTIDDWWDWIVMPIIGILTITSILSVFALVIFIIYSLVSSEGFVRNHVSKYINSRIYKGRDPYNIPEEELPLVIVRWRAFKDKVCPMISYSK